jgi:2-succinyl-6-hydroxy-2,4-cyclohexadiene-1-carboxylate synthase
VLKRLNGLDFTIEVEGDGPPLLLLHGFTGSVRAWDHIRPAIFEVATVIAVDLIGHGRTASPRDPRRYTLDWAVKDMSTLLEALAIDRVDLLGYSMGGRVALEFAVREPHLLRSLILESASPGIEEAAERQSRIDADEQLAQRIVEQGVAAFVAEWERLPLLALAPHVTETQRDRQHAQRLNNDPIGLANSLRGMGAGKQTPLWSRLGELQMPVQLIVGANDSRYVAIAQRMQPLLPIGALAMVAEAGHTVHLDQPDEFVRLVHRALDMPADCPKSTN